MQAEARRFLAALGRRAEQGGNSFSTHQLFDLSDHLQLKVPDMRDFIDQLNEAGRSPDTSALKLHAPINALSILPCGVTCVAHLLTVCMLCSCLSMCTN